MAGIDLNRRCVDKSKVRVKMDVVVEDVLGNALGAKGDEIGDPLSDLVDIAGFYPGGELFIDWRRALLKDKRGVVEVEGVDDVEFVIEGNGGIGILRGVEMEGDEAGLRAEMIKSELIASEISLSFPSDFMKSFRPELFDLVQERNFGDPGRRGVIDVLEEFKDMLSVFRGKNKTLIAAA
jgi:hypothetical protein